MANSADIVRDSNGLLGKAYVVFAAVVFAFFCSFLPEVGAGNVLRPAWDWIPSLGVQAAFAIDGLSLTFALLISGIGTLVLLYSNTYLAGHVHYARFALFLTAFMLSMLGLVLADDLILLFVFWELTTFTSYLLIGFGHAEAKSRRNALQALFVTGAGGLAFLAGLILLAFMAGTTRISDILTMGDALTGHAMYVPLLILLLAGAFTKSAQVPFHFWLPNAMAAPTPVSAFLHSATMVKGGVYLLARFHPALSGTDIWLWTLTIFGAVTAVYSSILALRQTDLKQALAYTTLMALGTLTMLLGHGSAYMMTAFATFLVTHSLYKAALFLMVGCIDKATGTREAAVLGGLGRVMPWTALAAALAALSMAGLPPFVGFIAKELAYAGSIAAASEPVFVTTMAFAANALMFAVAGIVAFKPFWRPAGGDLPKSPTEAPWPMLAGPLLLAILGTAIGLMPALAQTYLIDPTVAAVSGSSLEPKTLKLWAGLNLALYLSLATFVVGALLYLAHGQLRAALSRVFDALPSLDRGWDGFLDRLKALAAWQTGIIQSGKLSVYLSVTIAVIGIGLGATIIARDAFPETIDFSGATWKPASIAVLILVGTILTAFTNSRIAAVAGLGVVGIGTALVFIVFSAPDVAITQLLVETLVVVLVAVVMLRLPVLPKLRFRPFHAAMSLVVGAVVAITLLGVLESPLDERLTAYFEVTSWPKAYGQNIVNVILVDFRALDTFGEIAVVVIAALSAYALLRTTKREDRQ